MQIKSAKDLTVYKTAYELAMEVFAISKNFSAEEDTRLPTKSDAPLDPYVLIFEKRGRNVDMKRTL